MVPHAFCRAHLLFNALAELPRGVARPGLPPGAAAARGRVQYVRSLVDLVVPRHGRAQRELGPKDVVLAAAGQLPQDVAVLVWGAVASSLQT